MAVTVNGVLQVLIFVGIVLVLTKPFGLYIYHVFAGERTWFSPALKPVERVLYRISGVNEDEEHGWLRYTIDMLVFSVAGMLLLYLIERTQQIQGSFFNPANLPNVEPGLAFNTAASFTTNTNWQSYTGETTMSYFTQMAGLAVHNFTSAAIGIALAMAVIRGLTRRSGRHLGNFYVDLTRCILYILLPISIVGALFLISQGVPQNFRPYDVVTTLNGIQQTIAQGPVASQEWIKNFGTNGGGFFNANSAHPFENPNALTNIVTLISIFSIPAAMFYVFGKMTGNTKQGWALWIVGAVLFFVGIAVAMPAEQLGNPQLNPYNINQQPTAIQSGGNMEGKEVRFGITDSALFAVVTTDTSCGAVNSFHDSYTPLGGLVPLTNIALGELVFGGVGSGIYDLLVFAIIAVFIAGLMVGRTPEYLGKKIERKEMMMAALAILILPASILGFSAVAVVLPAGLAGLGNAGPHGLSEILYAYTSANGNNGSAFAGLTASSTFYTWTLGMAMLIGRIAFVIPIMALAGALVRKRVLPAGLGTFPTTGALWITLLIGVVIIVGALTYFPAYSLGPIVEHLLMLQGKTF
ncbi:potassium-transporting ATPase potassium-binding subunit [Ktedonobacteria bacterium brp13]|nr:potassium-transporting ATPase potassium-binding subunit [Ktedonobacteria bacterium brp13]